MVRNDFLCTGAYSEDDQYIQSLWTILEEFTDQQKRQFLKFVTSCSRPPLLGFAVRLITYTSVNFLTYQAMQEKAQVVQMFLWSINFRS